MLSGFFLMYPGGDSNSQALRHTHLKRTCIPFQHLGLLYFPCDSRERTLKLVQRCNFFSNKLKNVAFVHAFYQIK